MDLLPLEKVFLREAKTKSQFPNMQLDYGQQYLALVNHLRSEIYKDIDVGLATNSESLGFYTAHNAEHFDEVVRYAGMLLGVESGGESVHLSPYELYMLLVAIRIHDIGNIHGREKHEKKCFQMLKEFGPLAGEDDVEKKQIAKIAEAHGGKTSSNSKDTIGLLNEREEFGSSVIRPRLIASIVRFADEICESRRRASNYLIKHDKMPKQSEIFHQYAASISASTLRMSEKRLVMKYQVKSHVAKKAWGAALSGPKMEVYLIDEILERLEKMDRERRYCNMHSREIYTINLIRATIDIVDDENHDIILTIQVPDLCDEGYPEDRPQSLTAQLSKFCGSNLSTLLIERKIQSNDANV